MLGSEVKCALKNEDIISITYYDKDMKKHQLKAFKFSVSHTTQKNEKRKSVSFFSDDSIEMISDIKEARTPRKKRKCTTKTEKEKKDVNKSK